MGAYGIILLAAGESLRLGKPKQLLLYNGTSLLQHALQVAIDTGIQPVIVVLGANAELLAGEIKDKNITIAINKEWGEGMASSIRCGLSKLLERSPEVQAAIILVCDQPYVTTKLLQSLVAKYKQAGKPIVASWYQNGMGTPALFDTTIFALLMALKGDTGAKIIIKQNPGWVSTVNFPSGEIDIDTMEDYEGLPLLNL